MTAAFHWIAEAGSCLLLLAVCLLYGAWATKSLTELQERLTRDGGEGLGNWFVVMVGVIVLVGFLILNVGLTIIGSFVDAWGA